MTAPNVIRLRPTTDATHRLAVALVLWLRANDQRIALRDHAAAFDNLVGAAWELGMDTREPKVALWAARRLQKVYGAHL